MFRGFSSTMHVSSTTNDVLCDVGTVDGDGDGGCDSRSWSENSSASVESSSSELTEDATSHSPPSSSSSSPSSLELVSEGPLFELSDLMAQLPIKRGLSKHFQGKSQSFTSLSNVRSIEDLAKKDFCYNKKMKSCKSYAAGLDSHKSYTPRTCTRTISKKATRSSCSSLLAKKSSFLGGRPPIPMQKNS